MLQKKYIRLFQHIGYCTAPFTFQKAKEKMRKLNKWGNECWNECWNDGLTWKECLWFASIQLYLIPTQANHILHLTEWLPGEWDAKEQVRNDVQRKPYKKRTVSHAGCLPTCIKRGYIRSFNLPITGHGLMTWISLLKGLIQTMHTPGEVENRLLSSLCHLVVLENSIKVPRQAAVSLS